MLEDPNFPLEPQLKAELVNYKEQKRLVSAVQTRPWIKQLTALYNRQNEIKIDSAKLSKLCQQH